MKHRSVSAALTFVPQSVSVSAAQLQASLAPRKEYVLNAADYNLDAPVTVPPGARLVPVPGTRLVIQEHFGRAKAALSFEHDSSLAPGACFWDRSITAETALPDPESAGDVYGPAIGLPYDMSERVRIEGVDLGNVYRGIRTQGSNYVIRDVTGMPCAVGIEADVCGNTARIDTVRFNDPWYPSGSAIDTFIHAHRVGVRVGRMDGGMLSQVFMLGGRKGFHLGRSWHPEWGQTGSAGRLIDCHADGCYYGAWVETGPGFWQGSLTLSGWSGWTFVGGELGTTGGTALVIDGPDDANTETVVTLLGTSFISAETGAMNPDYLWPMIDHRAGRLIMAGVRYRMWKGVNPDFPDFGLLTGRPVFLRAARGEVRMDSACEIQGVSGQPSVMLGSGLRYHSIACKLEEPPVPFDPDVPPPEPPPLPPPEPPPEPEPEPQPPPNGAITVTVGPGGDVAEPHQIPFDKMGPGSVARVLYRSAPYHSKLHLWGEVALEGVPGPGGELPVFDAADGIESPHALYYSSSIDKQGIITVAPRQGGGPCRKVSIRNLEFRGARAWWDDRPDLQAVSKWFINAAGVQVWYFKGCAGIAVYGSEDVTVENCRITDCENGIFAFPTAAGTLTRRLKILGNHIEGNGVPKSDRQHNLYISGIDTLVELNRFGGIVDWSAGANLKDRSAGFTYRYNYMEGGNRLLDLVDPEDVIEMMDEPTWGQDHVYGNVFLLPMWLAEAGLMHYGFDGHWDRCRPLMRFFHNTVVDTGNKEDEQWKVVFFRLDLDSQQVLCANNIFHSHSPDPAKMVSDLYWTSGAASAKLELNGDWSPEWIQSGPGSVTGSGIQGTDPGFINNGMNWALQVGSPCRGVAGPLPSWAKPVEFAWVPVAETWEPRASLADLGAVGG